MKVVLSLTNAAKLESLFQGAPSVQWLFLAKNYAIVRKLEENFSDKFIRYDISRLLNDIANDLRPEYMRWIDSVNEMNAQELSWWFGSISSRNVAETDIFQFVCYLETLRRICVNGKNPPDLVVVESYGLAREIKRWAEGNNIHVEMWGDQVDPWIKLMASVRYYLNWFKSVWVIFFPWALARITGLLTKKRALISQNPVMVHTYVHGGDVSDKGVFKDRYFPFLRDFLKSKGLALVYCPTLHGCRFGFFSIYMAIRNAEDFFLIPEDYLVFSDYLLAMRAPLAFRNRRIKALAFHGFEMHDILEEEQRTRFSLSMVEAMLLVRFFARIKGKIPSPGRIILWDENQVTHKAVVRGARAAFPDARIVGAQLFMHRANLLSLFMIPSEMKHSFAPDVLLATSVNQCAVAASFSASLVCRPAAALRYAHLFDDRDQSMRCSDGGASTLLVLLPFDLMESIELLYYVKGALARLNDGARILIKGHQDYTIGKLQGLAGEKIWDNRFEVFEGRLADALGMVRVVVASNSGAVIEAAVKGIPVVLLGRQTVLDQNDITQLDPEMAAQCYSGTEMAEAIERFLACGPEKLQEYRDIGRRLRERFFTPVNDKTLMPFIEA
ncbi:MAG: hypothetical protein V2A70_01805 [Candidatus Omnitrophota bacterium]